MINLAVMAAGWALSSWAATRAVGMKKDIANSAMDMTHLKRTRISWGGTKVVITQSADWYLYCRAEEAVSRVIEDAFGDAEEEDKNALAAIFKKATLEWCLGNDIGIPLWEDLEEEAVVELKVSLATKSAATRSTIFHFAQRVVELAKE